MTTENLHTLAALTHRAAVVAHEKAREALSFAASKAARTASQLAEEATAKAAEAHADDDLDQQAGETDAGLAFEEAAYAFAAINDGSKGIAAEFHRAAITAHLDAALEHETAALDV